MHIPERIKNLADNALSMSFWKQREKKTVFSSPSNLTDVALRFSRQLLSRDEENTVFSPLSIYAILGLVGAGSKGSTQNQILSFLNLNSKDELSSFSSKLASIVSGDGSSKGGPQLSFVDGVWIDKSLTVKPSFKHVVENIYKVAISQVDFKTKAEAVRDEVNSWAKMKTEGLINEILPRGSVHELTRLIFANALYFKGIWKNKFDESTTKDYEFHLLNGTSVEVSFMTSQRSQIVSCFEGFKVLKLPYEQGWSEQQGYDQRRFSMYIFLPDSKDGLRSLVDKLCSESGFLDRHLPREPVAIGEFLVPKFKISLAFEASRVLKGLGLKLPFSKIKADLSDMVDGCNENLYVENIYHKSFIDFNEQGTEAAAVTAGTCCVTACLGTRDPPRVDFVADHPFLFLIREDGTGTILFIGHLLNPTRT